MATNNKMQMVLSHDNSTVATSAACDVSSSTFNVVHSSKYNFALSRQNILCYSLL